MTNAVRNTIEDSVKLTFFGVDLFAKFRLKCDKSGIESIIKESFGLVNSTSLRSNQKHKSEKELFGVDKILQEIVQLENDISKYAGPHFNPIYRRLNERCFQFQRQLDEVDVIGKSDVRAKRKQGIMKVEAAAVKLSSRAHSDGNPCPGCE